jgi:hypothetical protein
MDLSGVERHGAFLWDFSSISTPMTSLSFMISYSTLSILTSVPEPNKIRSPALTLIGTSLPASAPL